MFVEDYFYRKDLDWELKFVLYPRRCNISKKIIFLEYAYVASGYFRRADFIFKTKRYHKKINHIIWLLKNKPIILKRV